MPMPFPSQFVERLHQLYPSQVDSILSSLCAERTLSLRINPLVGAVANVASQLTRDGIPLTPVPWYMHAFTTTASTRQITSHPLYETGALYIQNLSSMVPALLLDPHPGETVLDLCAAPGSKTTELATLMENQGTIIANDLSPARIAKLKTILAQQHVETVTTQCKPGQLLWRDFENIFDRVLVDAPCTMEGRFSCTDPSSYEDWSMRKVKQLSTRQKGLLRSGVRATRPGGLIVYSTCTLAPEENEEVVDWILTKEPVHVVATKRTDIPFAAGITTWGKQVFNRSLEHTKRILPSATMEGFYVALLQKEER